MNQEKKRWNYKNWSFRLLIYLIFFNLAIAYIVLNYVEGLHDPHIFSRNIIILSIITNLMLVAGVVLTILSIKSKEEKNYKYYISIIGFSGIILFRIFSFFS